MSEVTDKEFQVAEKVLGYQLDETQKMLIRDHFRGHKIFVSGMRSGLSSINAAIFIILGYREK